MYYVCPLKSSSNTFFVFPIYGDFVLSFLLFHFLQSSLVPSKTPKHSLSEIGKFKICLRGPITNKDLRGATKQSSPDIQLLEKAHNGANMKSIETALKVNSLSVSNSMTLWAAPSCLSRSLTRLQ